MSKGTNIWRGVTGISASLLAVTCAGLNIANANVGFINARLGTTNNIVVDSGDGSTDTIYYDSEFSSLAELVQAKQKLAEEISSEGAVLFKNNGALPLNIGSEKVTLWGLNSHFPTLGGMIGSSTTVNAEAGQPIYGIEEAFAERGFELNQTMIDLYSSDMVQAYARRGFGQTGHGG